MFIIIIKGVIYGYFRNLYKASIHYLDRIFVWGLFTKLVFHILLWCSGHWVFCHRTVWLPQEGVHKFLSFLIPWSPGQTFLSRVCNDDWDDKMVQTYAQGPKYQKKKSSRSIKKYTNWDKLVCSVCKFFEGSVFTFQFLDNRIHNYGSFLHSCMKFLN